MIKGNLPDHWWPGEYRQCLEGSSLSGHPANTCGLLLLGEFHLETDLQTFSTPISGHGL